MDRREHWRAVYASKAADTLSWHQAVPEPSLAALKRLGIGPKASFIDVGGGASRLAGALLERGWSDVTVLDIAAPALEAAQAQLGELAGRISWIVADVAVWTPERTFDVWHDRAVFHFLSEAEQRECYRRALCAALAADGAAIIAGFAPDGPAQCSGLPVCRYDAEGLAAELGPGFRLVEDWRETHVTPWGATQSFQWGAFRRA